jgi:SAM-dependent methyltransferase
MELAVGGEFSAMGKLERQLLVQHGLTPEAYVIDVGCGSGRLAYPLSEYLRGRYLGTDVVPELLTHARSLVPRPDWRFELVDRIRIPERDGQADMICFFSVFTHLLHEDSYRYLVDAHRVLKPGGKVVLSFLEFAIASHWSVFENNVRRTGPERPLDMFVGRDALRAWADHAGFDIEAFHDGDQPYIVLPSPIQMEDGTVHAGRGSLGQSVCVLIKAR